MTYEQTLQSMAAANERIVVMTAENRAAIRNLPASLGRRFIDVGICEQTMIGAAAGLALRGRTPVAHALATFMTLRAFEFIRTDVGIAHLPVKLVGAVAGFLSEANGPTHQAIEDIALMRGIPGMRIFCPADEQELVAAMPQVTEDPHPWYIRYTALPPVADHAPFEIGKAEQLTDGSDVGLLTYGLLLREALRAAEILGSQGCSTRVIHMRTLSPFDAEIIVRAAQETRMLVTLEDHFVTGGLYSIVSETLVAHRTNTRVLPIALDHRWFKPALLPQVLHYEGFTGEQIADRILRERG
jgi:transketolase